MKLYFSPLSPNARKTLMVQQLLNLDIEHQPLDFTKGEHKTPEYLKLNPNGKVPTLVDGEMVLWESNAIAAYLASKTDNNLWPKNNSRYDIIRWMNWEQAHWAPAIGTLVGQHIFAPMRGKEPNQELIAKGEAEVKTYGAVLNGQLETSKWLTGDEMTIADIIVASPLTYRAQTKAPIDDYKHLTNWLDRITELDAWKKSEPKFG